MKVVLVVLFILAFVLVSVATSQSLITGSQLPEEASKLAGKKKEMKQKMSSAHSGFATVKSKVDKAFKSNAPPSTK